MVLLTGDNPISNIQSECTTRQVLKAKLGLEVKIDKQIFKQRLAKMTSGEFDLVLAGWGPDYDDPLTFGDLFASWNLNNRGRYANPEMDRLIEVAQNEHRYLEPAWMPSARSSNSFSTTWCSCPCTNAASPTSFILRLKDMKRRAVGPEVDFTRLHVSVVRREQSQTPAHVAATRSSVWRKGVITVWFIATATFFAMHAVPGDPLSTGTRP